MLVFHEAALIAQTIFLPSDTASNSCVAGFDSLHLASLDRSSKTPGRRGRGILFGLEEGERADFRRRHPRPARILDLASLVSLEVVVRRLEDNGDVHF